MCGARDKGNGRDLGDPRSPTTEEIRVIGPIDYEG